MAIVPEILASMTLLVLSLALFPLASRSVKGRLGRGVRKTSMASRDYAPDCALMLARFTSNRMVAASRARVAIAELRTASFATLSKFSQALAVQIGGTGNAAVRYRRLACSGRIAGSRSDSLSEIPALPGHARRPRRAALPGLWHCQDSREKFLGGIQPSKVSRDQRQAPFPGFIGTPF
jgi:hypothetical protein